MSKADKDRIFTDTIDKGQTKDWCHLCGIRNRYFIAFQSQNIRYTRICMDCILSLSDRLTNFVRRKKIEESRHKI